MKPGDYESTRLSGTTGRHSTTAGTCGDLVPASPSPERLQYLCDLRAESPGEFSQLPIAERLPAQVHRGCGGCELWVGTRDRYGYGTVTHQGRLWRVHRLSWALHFGAIPSGLCVLHTCDMPSCVNPEHLMLGTQRANIADRESKGRGVVPVRSGGRWTGRTKAVKR